MKITDGHTKTIKTSNVKKSENQAVLQVILKLLSYCRAYNWAGYDPYDALNSKISKQYPLKNYFILRLTLTQTLKRLPINTRSLLGIERSQNPKAISLFLMAVIKLMKLGIIEDDKIFAYLINRIKALRSPSNKYWCWGYNFPWQTRNILIEKFRPNLVCTTFVANSLVDAYEICGKDELLHMAYNSVEYIVNNLYWTNKKGEASFSYPTAESYSNIHNANLLGAELLCRIYKYTNSRKILDLALNVIRYSVAKQNKDGSWYYGDKYTQRWVDNFHTGYNLCALKRINEILDENEFIDCLFRGYEFYMNNLFTSECLPKYYHNTLYPIDIHAIAQSIITLITFKYYNYANKQAALNIFNWSIEHMFDDNGYFYYQLTPYFKNKISYMRWGQAWMLFSLTKLFEEL